MGNKGVDSRDWQPQLDRMAVARATGRDRTASIQRVFLGLLGANLAVVGAKLAIGITTGSLSVIGDAIHSSVDAFNNIAFTILMRYAGAPPPDITAFSLWLLAGTLAVNAWVAWYEARKGRQLSSDLLLADAAHTRVDVTITIGVILGAIASRARVPHVDPVIALAIVVMIVRVAWQILKRGVPVLVDQAAHEPELVRRSAEGVNGVRSAYDIRSRLAAGVAFAELTIGVSGQLAVDEAHAISDAVE